MQGRSRSRGDGGFTLIELLVVIIILGILAGVVIFGVSLFRDHAIDTACSADVKQVHTAAVGYVSKYQVAAPDQTALSEFLQSYPSSSDYTVNYAPGVGTDYTVAGTKADGSVCGAAQSIAAGGVTTTTSTTGSSATTAAPILSFNVSAPGTPTAGQSFGITVTALAGASTDTSYAGTKIVAFSGPGTSPSGTAPTYPASVVFVSGVGTASVTLTNAEAATLTLTESTRSGQAPVTVAAASPSSLCIVSAPCTGVTKSSLGSGGSFSSAVSLIDSLGNTATAAAPITVSTAVAGTGSVSPASLSISAGQTQSASSFTLTLNNGSNKSATVTVTASGLTAATVTGTT